MMFKKISQNFIKSPLKICLISQTFVNILWHVCIIAFDIWEKEVLEAHIDGKGQASRLLNFFHALLS